MNRTFPAMVLKIECDSIMPGTSIPTGKNKKITWEYPRTLAEYHSAMHDLARQPRVVRVTLCIYVRDGQWKKLHIRTRGEPCYLPDLTGYASKEQRVARTAIIPAEVLREATRSAQS